ncbi:glycosyltransferase [Salinibacterium sp. M195]|uniref:glycosyltransferase n=1 Tax=Salinibacterium sp. M195 TaxID=2583374 RepID=UPI001C627459|nr:glycosyltransferase [Salinibacterium sp. M195]QYH36961.1 glycosyltransferase family 4 protein [Salinibacterium sp. M195]
MRVLVLLNSLELGGTQINAVDFSVALRAHGVESWLVGERASLTSEPNLLTYAAAQGVSIEIYDALPGMRAHAAQLSSMAGRLKVDLIHVYGMWSLARQVFWGPSRFGGVPWMQTVYEMSVAPIVLRHMPLIVGTGYLVDELVNRPGPTILISPPVDMDRDSPTAGIAEAFRRENDLGDGLLLGIVSRLDSNMKATSIEVAIEAMRSLAAAEVTLFIVGAGDGGERLEAQAREVNAAVGREVVRMLGARVDPRPAYAAADIMLGMGGSAARSLAFGRPLVVQGEAGWSQLFEPATADSLARSSYWSPDAVSDPVGDLIRAVLPLIADGRRRAELGSFGRDFAARRFGLEAMTARLATFYQLATRAYGRRAWISDLPSEARRLGEKIMRRIHRAVAGDAT